MHVYHYKWSDWRDLMDQIGFNNRHLLDTNAISKVSGAISVYQKPSGHTRNHWDYQEINLKDVSIEVNYK